MAGLTDNSDALHRAKPRGAIAFVFGDRQRLAPIFFCWPDEVSRANNFLAGRSLAAIFPLPSERDQREPETQ
jgi:hypothetical protein